MKRLLMTLALTSLLSVSALAGDMHTTDSPSPAPGGTPQGMRSSTSPGPAPQAPGDMPTTDAIQPVLDGALSALLAVLGLVA